MDVDLFKLGLILIFLGIILVIVATLLIPLFINQNNIQVSTGGCIILLFIPICFGVGEQSTLLLTIALTLALIIVIINLFFYITIKRKIRDL